MALRYRAFLSYSHTDELLARRLHRRMEAYRLPAGLEPVETPEGFDARRLTPVFRDRDELVAAGDLGATIQAALRESAALVLVASPASAQSHYVNEEVRAFAALQPARPVFVYIVAGEPGAVPPDPGVCFPPALREAGAAEPIAADARPGKDGVDLAFLKVAAPLFGVRLAELRDREARRRLRRRTVAAVTSLGIALVLAAISVFAFQKAQEADANAVESRANEKVADEKAEEARKLLIEVGKARVRAEAGEKDAKKQRGIAEERADENQRALATFQVERGRQLVLQGRPLSALPFLLAGREHAPDPELTRLLLSQAVMGARPFRFELGPLQAAVRSARVTRDGARVLVDDEGGATHVFDLATGRSLGVFNGNTQQPYASVPCVDADGTLGVGQQLADRTQYVAHIVRLAGDPPQAVLQTQPGAVAAVDWVSMDPSGTRIVASAGRKLHTWAADQPEFARRIEGVIADSPRKTAFASDGRRAAFVFETLVRSAPNTARAVLLDLVSAKRLQRVEVNADEGAVSIAVDTRRGWWVVTWGDRAGDIHVALHDLETGAERGRLALGRHPRQAPEVLPCPDADRFLVWTEGLLAPIELGAEGLRRLPTAWKESTSDHVMRARWGRGGASLLVHFMGRAVHRVAIAGEELKALVPGSAVRVEVDPALDQLAVQRDLSNVELVDLGAAAHPGLAVPAHGGKTLSLDVDRAQQLLLTTGTDGFLRGWSLAPEDRGAHTRAVNLDRPVQATFPPEVYGFTPSKMVVSHDGTTLAHVGRTWVSEGVSQSLVVVLDAQTMREKRRHIVADPHYERLMISADGKRVVLAVEPGQAIQIGGKPRLRVHVLEAESTRHVELPLERAIGFGTACGGLSASGRQVLFMSRPGRLMRFDLASGASEEVFADENGLGYLLSPDGTLLVTMSGDQVRFHRLDGDLGSRKLLLDEAVPGARGATQVVLRSDGKAAMTWIGNIARVWSEASGRLVRLEPEPPAFGPITLAPDSDEVIIGQPDGSILMHAIETGALRRRHARPPPLPNRNPMALGATSSGGIGHSPRAMTALLQGRVLAVVGLDRMIRLTDMASGKLLAAIAMDPNPTNHFMTVMPGDLPWVQASGPAQDHILLLDHLRGSVGRWRVALPEGVALARATAIQARNPRALVDGRLARRAVDTRLKKAAK